ncbi:MAG TPA: Bax inhibitor-1/YccA family protein [Aggregatilineales bacterium]|nr:Bax inhibitor-1/YccA family protein [Anaerolineales bacterium]HRE48541.1 Bax inhibitor-1/YccA family protein [Aggregatilineales bacterium]
MGFSTYSESRAEVSSLDFSKIMRAVYLWLAIGLSVGFGIALMMRTAGQAAIASGDPTKFALFSPGVMLVTGIAYIVLAIAFQPLVMRSKPAIGSVLYLALTVVFGLMISVTLTFYSDRAIIAAFAATAGMFGVMSILGYTTKMDLSKIGSVLIMALIGLVIASIINIFLKSPALYWLITYAGVIIFAGLTAWDTQKIKQTAAEVAVTNDGAMAQRVALIGAFTLFLDFVNLFLYLLRIFGSRD